MNRRTCLIGLGGVGTAVLAGCLGDDSGDNSEDSDSGFALVEHDFNRSENSNSIEFTGTVENNTDTDHNIDVELEVNSDGSLVDNASFEVTVRPGETGNGGAFLTELESPVDVTDYVVRLSEGLFPDLTVEREFSGDEFRTKLNG